MRFLHGSTAILATLFLVFGCSLVRTNTTGTGNGNPGTSTKTIPKITWKAPASITFGTALSTAQLNATASVPGTFVYTPAAGTVLPIGSHTLKADFTPADLAKYTIATASVSIEVNQTTGQCIDRSISKEACGELLPEKLRISIINSVKAYYDGLFGLSESDRNEKLRTYLANIPQFRTVGIEEKTKTVWGIFSDGVVFAILPRTPEEPSPSQPSALAMQNANNNVVIDPSDMDTFFYPGRYPESRMVALYRVKKSGLHNKLPQLQKWFEKKGYRVVTGKGQVEDLLTLQISNLAVFYFDGHGGISGDKDHPEHALIGSGTAVSSNPAEMIQSGIRAGYIIPCITSEGDEVYCFNEQFFTFLNFGKNAMAIIDTCFGYNEITRNMLLQKVDLYGGWSGEVFPDFAENVMNFLFSRSLGQAAADNSDKPSRAFPIGEIYDYLVSKGKTVEQRPGMGNARFIMRRREGGELNNLSPSIEQMTILTGEKNLSIKGEFSKDPGEDKRKVLVNEQPVNVKDWDGARILTELPPLENGGVGPVVIDVDGVRSNAIPLVSLRTAFKAEFKGELTQKCSLNANFAFRTDPHEYRQDPEVVPKTDDSIRADLSRTETKGTLVCTGSNKTANHCKHGGPTSWTEWSGSKTLTCDAPDPLSYISGDLVISNKLKQSLFGPMTLATYTITEKYCDGSTPHVSYASITLEPFYEGTPPNFGINIPTAFGPKGELILKSGSRQMAPNKDFKGGGNANWTDFSCSQVIPPHEPR